MNPSVHMLEDMEVHAMPPPGFLATSSTSFRLPDLRRTPIPIPVPGDVFNIFGSAPLKERAMEHLAVVNENLGKKPCSGLSIGQFMKVVRRAFAVLPFDEVASTFGLSADDLAELVSYNALRRKRRMNALNPTALTRSMTRIRAFDRRCKKVQKMLKK